MSWIPFLSCRQCSLYPAEHLLLCPELVQCCPAMAPSDLHQRSSKQAAPSERSWKNGFGLSAHPAVCLVIDNNFSHALIPARPSCAIYVEQVALQSNDTMSSSVTPSFLAPGNTLTLISRSFSYISDMFRGGVGSI